MKRIISLIIMTVLILFLVYPVSALDKRLLPEIDTNQLTENTQISAPSGDNHINFLWWIPIEFWEAAFSQDNTTSEVEKKQILDILKPYSLLAVCQADISDLGAFAFYGKEIIEENIQITFKPDEGELTTLNIVDRVKPEVQILLNIFKPILSSAMGSMGENFHFFVLKDFDNSGNRHLDPYSPGTLEFHLKMHNGERLNAQLVFPLDSLYIPRICPNGKVALASWTYCPWTGEKLPQ